MLHSALVSLALVLVTVLCYADVGGHEFLAFDDDDYVTLNPIVRDGFTVAGVGEAFSSVRAHNWHPLTWLSHMLDVELFGLAPAGHHWMNVALHCANAVLLLLGLHGLTGAFWRSAFVAALFALHPLHVESVAWVAERKDVLSTLPGLLAVGGYARWVRTRSRAVYLGALALFAASLMAKPTLVTLPFALLLLDVWPLGRVSADRLQGLRGALLDKLPFLALSLASSAITLLAHSRTLSPLPLELRIGNALLAYPAYLGKTLWPAGLAAMYPHTLELAPWAVAGAALLLGVLSVAALSVRRDRPYLAVGWLLFLGTLVPTLGLVQTGLQSMADRYTYVPLIGLFAAFAWGGWSLLHGAPASRQIAAAGAALLLVPLALTTRAQVRHWRDTRTLFQHAVEVTRDNWFAHTELGIRLGLDGETEAALAHLQEAVRLHPHHARAQSALGTALGLTGDLAGAQAHGELALRLDPRLPNGNFALAASLERAGRLDRAIAHYRRELALDPAHRGALLQLARLLSVHPDAARRNGAEALALTERACGASGCDTPRELDVVALTLAELGRFEQASATTRLALERARTRGELDAARMLSERLALYEAGRPLRLTRSEP